MALLTLGISGAWAQTGTITYSISTYSSAGSFSSTQVWNSNGTPKMTMTYSGSNGYNTGNGRIFKGDYTLSVSGGYIITGYSITGHCAWNGSNGDVERITPATGTITDGDGNTVTYLDFAGSDVTLNVSNLNSQSVSFTMAQTAGSGNGAFDATAITITYQVDPQRAFPQLTTDLSSPKYYSIKSYNRGGYLSSNGSGQAMTHVDFKDGSVWYFTAADGNTSGNAMNGVIAHNFDGTAMTTSWQTSETGGTVYILPNGVNANGLSISKTASISGSSCCDAKKSNTGVGDWSPSSSDWEGTTWVIEPTIPSGYYYFKGMDTGRYPYLYSNFVGKGENATYHHSPLSGTNGEIWKVTNNGSSLSIINGEGLPLTIGTTTYETLNIGSVAEGPDFYFTQAINLTNEGNDTKLTTWAGHPDATDNHWTFEAVDVSAGLYNVVIEGNANGYVTYNGQNAKNGGFFVAESIASSDLIAFDISDYTEVVSVEGTTITVTYEEDGETINYTLTDTNDATYTGTYKGTVGTTEPTLTGCVGYTLSDKVWDGSTFTATINFPFAISSNNVENLTYIGSFHNKSGYSSESFLWHANGTSVTVHDGDVPNNTKSEGVYTDNEKYEWAIFPAIADNNITFTIKNASTGTFINNTTTGSNHNAGTVTLSETATPVQYATGSTDKCGTIYKWYIPSTSNYLSVNSVTGGTNQVLGVHGTDHDGLSIGFHTPTNFAALDANLIAACTSYQSAQGLIGSEYGQYSGDALAGMEEAYLSATTAVALTAAQLTTYTTTLENPTSHLTLNVPQAGDFLRIKASTTNKEAYQNPTPSSDLYLTSSNTQTDVNNSTYKDNRVGFVEGTANDNTTVFYYDGNYLTGFANGLQPVNNNSQLKIGTAGASATKITFESIESTEAKAFRIEFNDGGRSLYTQRYSGAYFTDAAGGNATDAHYRYFLEKVTSLPVTFVGEYASFFSPIDLTIPEEGVTVYTGEVNGEWLTLNEITGTLPANTGVILKGTAGSTVNFPILSTVNTENNTALTGTVAAQTAVTGGVLVLGKSNDVWGIYNYEGTLGGFKAYMDKPAGVKGLAFSFGDADAIATLLNGEQQTKEMFDLSGRRISQPTRGLYIVNGKKVLVK